MAEDKVHVDFTEADFGLETRKVRALEKIASNLEAITMFCEGLNAEEWSDRIQWYLDMVKRAYLDSKLQQ